MRPNQIPVVIVVPVMTRMMTMMIHHNTHLLVTVNALYKTL